MTITPEMDAAAEAESKATAARADQVLRLLDQNSMQIDRRLALSLVYIGVLMARDLDVPENAIATWIPKLYQRARRAWSSRSRSARRS